MLHICICFLGRQFFSNFATRTSWSKNVHLDKTQYCLLSSLPGVCVVCTYLYLYLHIYIKIGNRVIQIQVSNIRSGTSDFLSRKLVDVYQQIFCLRRNHWMEFLKKKVILNIFHVSNPQIWERAIIGPIGQRVSSELEKAFKKFQLNMGELLVHTLKLSFAPIFSQNPSFFSPHKRLIG